MNPARRKEEEIFDAARRLHDATQRREYLDRTCAGNAGLRSRLGELLDAVADAEQFFAAGGAAVQSLGAELGALTRLSPAKTAGEEPAGRRIGNYKLLERIGEGGCGVVYMAEQEKPVRRRVALKIIKLGMDTKSVIARFEAERQALAMMDHPNIARVLEAGATESGRPYFVMELVRGFKITEYCDANQLETRERLDLFVQVCQAIQHAHQKGVIHRDIKPSNILVTLHDGVPVPKVIDFGIAKATETHLTEKTLFTAYAQVIGTPAYMSPEQAEMSGLDVDTRADIYSLGVLLYELLTGRTPFDAKQLLESGFDGMRRTLMEREPQKPSTMLTTLQNEDLAATAKQRHAEPPRLISQLRGDLDWIVMKALEKDRKRRYETANGLAMDINRYLDHEPIVARPPSRLYRLKKLVRRNRGVFAAAGAVALALVAGFAFSTWLFLRERQARERAVAAEQQQTRLRQAAERATALEAEMRQRAEAREKITQAAVMINEHRLAEADRLLGEIPLTMTLLEGADVFRVTGEWNALRTNWPAASDRFQMLLRAGKVETLEHATLDHTRAAVSLLEEGDGAGYERYRRAAVARFLDVTDATAAERTIKHVLLRPANKELLDRLRPLTLIVSNSITSDEAAWKLPWHAISLALFEYRCGRNEEAVRWAQRCLEFHVHNTACDATIRAILAMAYSQLGQIGDARAELDQSRQGIEARLGKGLDAGSGAQGYWFDWVLGRILMREAVTVLGETPHSLAKPAE
jgi:serine/threonine protein kinase